MCLINNLALRYTEQKICTVTFAIKIGFNQYKSTDLYQFSAFNYEKSSLKMI